MGKTYRVIISRFAENDLEEIVDYYFRINAAFAKKLLLRIEKRVNELKTSPSRGRIVPELHKQNIKEYREIIEGNYRIIYAIQEELIMIHAILDGRRNIEEILIDKLTRLYAEQHPGYQRKS